MRDNVTLITSLFLFLASMILFLNFIMTYTHLLLNKKKNCYASSIYQILDNGIKLYIYLD